MALLHRAELNPSKLELLAAWLPGRPWYQASASLARVASYRFDDPAGAVGIETMLLTAGEGPVYQVPLTYRDAPLEGGASWLIGTTDHSVLGKRWVYDACGDPVYAAALASVVVEGTSAAEEFFEVDGQLELRPPSMRLTVSGALASAPAIHREGFTVVAAGPVELTVAHRLDDTSKLGGAVLSGTWSGQSTPVPLASASRRS